MKQLLELGRDSERTVASINNRLYGWWKDVKDYFWDDTRGAVISMVRLLLQECLEVEASNQIGAGYYQHKDR